MSACVFFVLERIPTCSHTVTRRFTHRFVYLHVFQSRLCQNATLDSFVRHTRYIKRMYRRTYVRFRKKKKKFDTINQLRRLKMETHTIFICGTFLYASSVDARLLLLVLRTYKTVSRAETVKYKLYINYSNPQLRVLWLIYGGAEKIRDSDPPLKRNVSRTSIPKFWDNSYRLKKKKFHAAIRNSYWFHNWSHK